MTTAKISYNGQKVVYQNSRLQYATDPYNPLNLPPFTIRVLLQDSAVPSVAKYGVCCADDRAEYIHAYHAVKQGKSPQDTPRKPRLNLTPEERKQRKKEQKHRWYLKHRERNLEYAHKYYMLKQQASKEAA